MAIPFPPSAWNQWVKQLRAARDLTQEQLAEQVGCAVQTIRMLETDRRRPSREMTARIAEVLDVPAPDRPAFLRLARMPQPSAAPALAAEPAPPGPQRRVELPRPSNPLLGREHELAQLRRVLVGDSRRLVTLLGPGGVGKTRLALEAAAELGAHFAHGAAWVSLAAFSAADQLAPALAAAFNLTLPGADNAQEQLIAFLHGREVLLVLDNAEHLNAVPDLAATLLEATPGVRLLVTSRQRLSVPGEWTVELGGLAVPAAATSAAVERAPAAQLFVDRARQLDHTFALSAANSVAITRICQLLEGLPLAIELAAAWTRALAPAEIAAEIGRSLDVLATDDRSQPARHRSLQTLFAHSWELLGADERRVLAALSVFAHSCGRAAAEQVAGGTLALLAALIDKSLLRRTQHATGATRYGLHAIIHHYAAEKLAADPAAEAAARQQHCAFYAALLEAAVPQLQGSEPAAALAELVPDLANLRRAWLWAVAQRQLPQLRQMTVGLAFLAELRGWLPEDAELFGHAVAALRAALAETADAELRWTLGQILGWYGRARGRLGDTVLACELIEEAAGLLADNEPALARSGMLGYLGLMLTYRGRFAEARAVLERNLALLRPLGQSFFMAPNCIYLAFVTHAQGDVETTRALLAEARRYAEASGRPRGLTLYLCKSAWVANDHGQPDVAEPLAREALRIGALHRDRWGLGWALFQLGRVMLARGELSEGFYLLNESAELFEETGDPWSLARVQIGLGLAERDRGDPGAARQRLLEVLRVAWRRQYETLALDALCGIAELAADAGATADAGEQLAMVATHPATEQVVRARAVARLQPDGTAPPVVPPAASLDELVSALL